MIGPLFQTPTKGLASNLSLQYHFESNIKGLKNKGGDDQLKKLSIVKQILLVTYLGKCVDKSREKISTDVRMLRVELDNR